jgi:hypothetical protein
MASLFNCSNDNKSSADVNVIESFVLFNLLFGQIKRELNILMKESCEVLLIGLDTKNEKSEDESVNSRLLFTQVDDHLVAMLDLINKKLNCPVVYFDQDFIVSNIAKASNENVSNRANATSSSSSSSTSSSSKFSNSVIDKHRRIMWEIGENYDTFGFLKQSVVEV